MKMGKFGRNTCVPEIELTIQHPTISKHDGIPAQGNGKQQCLNQEVNGEARQEEQPLQNASLKSSKLSDNFRDTVSGSCNEFSFHSRLYRP